MVRMDGFLTRDRLNIHDWVVIYLDLTLVLSVLKPLLILSG